MQRKKSTPESQLQASSQRCLLKTQIKGRTLAPISAHGWIQSSFSTRLRMLKSDYKKEVNVFGAQVIMRLKLVSKKQQRYLRGSGVTDTTEWSQRQRELVMDQI